MKAKKLLFRYFPWLVSAVVLYFFVRKVDLHMLTQMRDLLLGQIESSQPLLLWVAVLLSITSVLVESLKWCQLLRTLTPTTYQDALSMTMRGMSSSLMMPSRTGDFIGKIYRLPAHQRTRAFGLSAIGNLMQMAHTSLWGALAIAWYVWHTDVLSSISIPWLWALVLPVVLGAVYIFRLPILRTVQDSAWFFSVQKNLIYLKQLPSKVWLESFLLSGVRYAIFITQYYLLFRGLGIDIAWYQVLIAQSAVYLTLSSIPHTMLVDIALRGPLSVVFYSVFGVSTATVMLAAYCLYFLNILLPALIGLPFLKSLKLRKVENS